MALIARRKVSQTWREAVASRGAAFGQKEACLAAFDAALQRGDTEFEAAYRALAAHEALWPMSAPDDASAVPAPALVGAGGDAPPQV